MGIGLTLTLLTACTTTDTPSPVVAPPPVSPVTGPAPEPVTLPVDLTQPTYTPAHMRGRGDLIRVGVLLPFSASQAAARAEATQILHAAELALFERGSDTLLLLPKDTSGTREGARAAAEAVIADGADLIIGPLFAEAVEGAASVARQEGVAMIAFSTDERIAGNGVYLLSFPPAEEVRRIVDYAADQGAERFAFIGPANQYGQAVARAYQDAIDIHAGNFGRDADPTTLSYETEVVTPDPANPGAFITETITVTRTPARLVAEEYYSGGIQAMTDAARRLARLGVTPIDPIRASAMTGRNWRPDPQSPFQVVLLPEGGDNLRMLAPVLLYQDIDPLKIKFLGTGLWNNSATLREPALANGWFAGPDPRARSRFESVYNDSFGRTPSRLSGLGYDAISLANLIARMPGQFETANFENPEGFIGVDGLFRFRPDGTIERGMAVYTVRGGELRVLEPAQERFTTPVQMYQALEPTLPTQDQDDRLDIGGDNF